MEAVWENIFTNGGIGTIAFKCSDNVTLYAPELLVVPRCEFIKKAIEGSMMESQTKEINVEYKSNILKVVLRYLCCGKQPSLNNMIDAEMLFEVTDLARYWGAKYVEDYCACVISSTKFTDRAKIMSLNFADKFKFEAISELLIPMVADIILATTNKNFDEDIQKSILENIEPHNMKKILSFIYSSKTIKSSDQVAKKRKASPEL